MTDALAGPFADVRVLDLTTALGQYGGKLLADLGADVIKIEPPGGDPQRSEPPFFHDQADREHSLAYWYFNTNKRSVTCDIDRHDGQHLLTELVRGADVLIESFGPGYMDARGIGWDALRAVKPDLIYVSISGFGLTGPHRDWRAPDIVGQAMGGVLTLAGHPEDPPNVLAGQQGYISAGLVAAQGAALALYHKERTGAGQLVESSMQEALSMSQETAMPMWDFNKIARERQGEWTSLPGRRTYRSKDGWIYCMAGQPDSQSSVPNLIRWMDEHGMAEDLTTNQELMDFFETMDMRTLTGLMQDPSELARVQPILDRADQVVERFFASLTSRQAEDEGQARRILVNVVGSPRDVMEDPYLAERDWCWVDDSRSEPVRIPGPPYRLGGTPLSLRRPAPSVGQHNDEVWKQDVGVSNDAYQTYLAEGVL